MTQEDVVHISLSCLNLPSECVQGVRIAVGALFDDGNVFTEIGQTETIVGHINPVFQRIIPIVTRLDQHQILKFMLYLIDGSTEVIVEKCGEVEVNLFPLLNCSGQITFPLHFLPSSSGYEHSQQSLPLLVVSATLSEASSRGTTLQFIGESLRSEYGNVSPLYFIMELVPNSLEKARVLLYHSEVSQSTENPKWREFTIPTIFFPNNSDWNLEISCYCFINNADDILLGSFSTTFYQLISAHGHNKFMLRKGAKKRQDACMELVHVHSVENIPSFLNILKSGLQMHFTVAIDFTANNGGPNNVDSLHHIHPYNSNAYMNVLNDICPTLVKFDKLNRISLLGFGAKVPPNFELSQNFALNGDLNNPHVKGLNDVILCYRNNAITLMPYAPTEYSGVIHHVIKLARASVRTAIGYYFTIVILTNGAIRDIGDAADTIVQASELPISVVFVVVGNSSHPVGSSGKSFKLMQLLSPNLKSSRNEPLKRETVSIIVNNQGHNPTSLVPDSSFITHRILASVRRQTTLWALKNS